MDEQIGRAAREYIDSSLVLPFEPDAQQAALEMLGRREGVAQDESRSTVDVTRAQENAVRLLREAERIARSQGRQSVDAAAVQAAFVQLCPGLFPIC